MESAERSTAVGVFDDRSHAQYAVEQLRLSGFTPEQIGVIVPDEASGIEPPPMDHGTKVGEGAATGAVAGLALGGLLGAALATVVLPGVGTVIAGGILASLLGGAAAGAASGGVLGALIGLDIPAHEAAHYEREFHSGRTLVTVRANGRYDEAIAILNSAALRPEHKAPPHRFVRGDGDGDDSSGGASVVPGL